MAPAPFLRGNQSKDYQWVVSGSKSGMNARQVVGVVVFIDASFLVSSGLFLLVF